MSGNLSPLLNRYFVCHIRLVLVLKRTLPSIDYILSHPPTPICDYMMFCTFCKYCLTFNFPEKRPKKCIRALFSFLVSFMSGRAWTNLSLSCGAKRPNARRAKPLSMPDTLILSLEKTSKKYQTKIGNQKEKMKNQSTIIISHKKYQISSGN